MLNVYKKKKPIKQAFRLSTILLFSRLTQLIYLFIYMFIVFVQFFVVFMLIHYGGNKKMKYNKMIQQYYI